MSWLLEEKITAFDFSVCFHVELVRGGADIEILISSLNCDQEQNLEVCLDLRDN